MYQRVRNFARRLNEEFNERRLGISTAEWHTQIVDDRPEFRGYAPTTYRDWRVIRRHIMHLHRHNAASSTFVDYGAGLGRSTVLAAKLPFARVIGVEFDRELVARGNANIRAAGLNAKAQIVCADAAAFSVPQDAMVFYFCNPFTGSVLAGALDQIKRSYLSRIRPISLVCNLPPGSAFAKEIRTVGAAWLKVSIARALSDGRLLLIFTVL